MKWSFSHFFPIHLSRRKTAKLYKNIDLSNYPQCFLGFLHEGLLKYTKSTHIFRLEQTLTGSDPINPVWQVTGLEIAARPDYNQRAVRPRNRPPPWTEESAWRDSLRRTSVSPREGMCMHIKIPMREKELDTVPLFSRLKASDTLWFRRRPAGEDEIQKCAACPFVNVYLPARGLPISWLGFGVRSGCCGMLWHLSGFPYTSLTSLSCTCAACQQDTGFFPQRRPIFCQRCHSRTPFSGSFFNQYVNTGLVLRVEKQGVPMAEMQCSIRTTTTKDVDLKLGQRHGQFPQALSHEPAWPRMTGHAMPKHWPEKLNTCSAWNIAIGRRDHSSYGVLKPISFTFFSAEVPLEGSQFKVKTQWWQALKTQTCRLKGSVISAGRASPIAKTDVSM